MVNCRLIAKSFIHLLLITIVAHSSGHAAIFKCQGLDGQVAYQERPCNKDDSTQTVGPNLRQATDIGSSELKSGIMAFEKQDFKKAASILVPFAENGVPEAQYYAAQLYINGVGVQQDSVKALKLMQSSADNGFEKAKLGISGFMWYLFGFNIGNIRSKIPDAVIRVEIWKRSKTAFLMQPCNHEIRNEMEQFVGANKVYAEKWEKLREENGSCVKCHFPCD